jgi:hypothetical protein
MACLGTANEDVVIVMKIGIPILAALLVLATELMARAALQGFEQALVWTLVDWSARRVRVARRKFWRGRESLSQSVRTKIKEVAVHV